jgi:hypothetical protein
MTTPTIHLPPATVKRLEALVAQQQAITAVIEATIATAREALGVPDTYTLRNLAEGFIALPEPAREATE